MKEKIKNSLKSIRSKILLVLLCLLPGVLMAFIGASNVAWNFSGLVFDEYLEDCPECKRGCKECNNGYIVSGYVVSNVDLFYNPKQLTIPDTYKGLPVVGIGDSAFDDSSKLVNITIPASVTFIGDNAFTLDDTFKPTSKLISITFANDSQLSSIGSNVFSNCINLASITIPDSVTEIGNYAFQGCNSLTSITIPGSVTEIGHNIFYKCINLKSIDVASSNSVYHVSENCLIETASKLLITSCESSIIPDDDSVIAIGEYAFQGRNSLTSVSIPDNITVIKEYAFCDCENLAEIYIPESVVCIGANAFDGCSNLIEVENNVFYVNNWVIGADSNATQITLRCGTTGIADESFIAFSNLERITVPESVTYIGTSAFKLCRKLTHITFEGSMEQWDAITKGSAWSTMTGKYTVYCTDGEVPK